MYAAPEALGSVLPVSRGAAALITVGVVLGLSVPAIIGIWRSLSTMAHLATSAPNLPSVTMRGLPSWSTLQTVVEYGLATGLLALLFLLMLPLLIRLFALGGMSVTLSLVLLIATAVAMGIISFRVHRVLEPAFRDTFISGSPDPVAHATGDEDALPLVDPESPAPLTGQTRVTEEPRRRVSPLIAAIVEQANRRGAASPGVGGEPEATPGSDYSLVDPDPASGPG